jgi:hypothetical protein
MNDAYRALEEAALALLEAGSDEALFHHLVIMARAASEAGRPDLALLNVSTAAEVAERAGVTDVAALEALVKPAASALDVPFASVHDERAVLDEQVRRLLRLAAHRRTLAGSLHPEQRFEYEVTGQELEGILRGARATGDSALFTLERDVLAGRLLLERRSAATPSDVPTVSGAIGRLGLSPLERDVLLAALAPELDEGFLRAYMRVWGDYTKREPDVGFVCGLVALNPDEQRAARLALEGDARLATLRLVTFGDEGQGHPGLGLRRPVRVAPWLVRLSLGHEQPGLHRLSSPMAAARVAGLAGDLHGAVATAAAVLAGEDPAPLVALSGDDRDDLLAVVLAAAGERPLFGARLAGARAIDAAMAAAGEALGLGGALVLELSSPDPGSAAPDLDATLGAVANAGCPAVVLAGDEPDRLAAVRAPLTWARVAPLAAADQVRAWAVLLGVEGDARRAQVLGEVAARYPLGLAAIARAAHDVRQRGAEASLEGLLDAARAQLSVRAVRLSQRVPLAFHWEDLVLPDKVLVALNEVVTYYRYRAQVYDQWGFRRKVPYGRALSALFHGPSGTGKTMAATVLASEFKVPLFQVNLASITSKYVGETEKNLNVVFDDATRSHAMLLFDEADSLFSKRTSGGSAMDRYSNLEVNFLLQRMEEYDGMVVLTTNLESEIDSAFKRRIRFKVHFPAPDAEQREQLWRSMLKGVGEVASDVDYAELASRFDLAGGGMKNAVIRAAFQAVEEGCSIEMRHLVKAAVRECHEAGQLVRQQDGDE